MILRRLEVGDQGVVLVLRGRGSNPAQLAHVRLGDGAVVRDQVDRELLA